MGTLPTPPPGPRYTDPGNVGPHSYHFNPFEKNGIIYTCRGGHLDLPHIRWNADYTKYLIGKTRETLLKTKKGYDFKLTWEPSRHYITFEYPQYWSELTKAEKMRIASEIAFEVGPYITFDATLWHEILTWFGTKFAGFEPEFNSAFSWEDMYSNLVGVRLGLEAIRSGEDYDKAMETAINQELKKLGAIPRSTAIEETKKLRGKWYTGLILVDTLKRNMDTGKDDGYITPTLMPDLEICGDSEPLSYPVPVITTLEKYGFSMNHEIKPNVWETGKIVRAINESKNPPERIKKINVSEHYPILMDFIIKQAIEEYGYDVDH